MGRLFLLVLLAFGGWYAYTNGIFYNATHSGQPEPGRDCELVGPVGTGVNLVYQKEDMRYVIDTHIGSTGQKMEANANLEAMMRGGSGFRAPDHTQAKVLESGKTVLYGVTYMVTKVQITGGDSAGTKGWVERDNVLDTPMMKFVQSMRGTSVPTHGRGGMGGGMAN